MERIKISEQDILNASPYMPLVLKYTLAKYISEFGIDKKQISVKEKDIETIALPDMYQRNTMREAQFKIGVFVKEYMQKEFDPVKDSDSKPIPYLMAADDADKWADFETQLDRLKRGKNKDIADKCYDILNDYHAFVRMVSIETEQELQIRNDIVGRGAWAIDKYVSKIVLDGMNKAIESAKPIAEDAEEVKPEE